MAADSTECRPGSAHRGEHGYRLATGLDERGVEGGDGGEVNGGLVLWGRHDHHLTGTQEQACGQEGQNGAGEWCRTLGTFMG